MSNRNRQIIRASWVGVWGNALLSVLKISVGLIAGSLAVVGDGIDSAGDIIASVITLLTARLMSRPPNMKFPYGYEKADALASKVLSFIMFFAGAQLGISAVSGLIRGVEREMPAMFAIYATLISIAGKLLLSWHQHRAGKKLDSPMLVANGRNMQNDVIISGAVLAGLFFTFFLKLPVIDSITAILVSLWIMYAAYGIFMKTNPELLDGVHDEKIYDDVFRVISSIKGVYNPHRARIRKVGNQFVIAIDIEVDGNKTVHEAHDIARQVEDALKSSIANVYDILVHVEPYGNIEKDEKYGVSGKDIHGIS
ncbi:MAG: cation diffusion facilitator family transporter [Bacteroidetes bacterium]|nr:cation diffusion facilitator family transporter [Bacteroidota bacterium]